MVRHGAPGCTLHRVRRCGRVDVYDTGTRSSKKHLRHAFVPRPALAFDSVRLLTVAGLSLETHFRGEIQHNGQVGRQTVGRELVGPHHPLSGQPASCNLVRLCGQIVAVAQHHLPTFKRGADDLCHLVCTRRKHEEQLGERTRVHVRIERGDTRGLGNRSPTRLPHLEHIMSGSTQPACQTAYQGCLPGPVGSVHDNERPRHHLDVPAVGEVASRYRGRSKTSCSIPAAQPLRSAM